MFNEQSIKDKIRFKANQMNISFNTLMKMYVFECILKRLSNSTYKNKIVLKGGALLCSLYGLDNRVTQDMDLSIIKYELKKETINSIFQDILKKDLNDGIHFTLINSEPINTQIEYEGYRLKIEYRFNKMRDIIYIDIATGDYITPKPVIYNYPQILENKIETEKIQNNEKKEK